MTDLLLPLIFLGVSVYGISRGVDIYGALLLGAREGMGVVLGILPALVALLTGISMLRASGALDLLATWLAPFLGGLGIPGELLPLMVIRPFSGSGALGIGAELMERFGADSPLGLMASVMLGSTETTFYTVAVYFGAVGVTKTRYAIPAALCADLAGFFFSCFFVRLLLLG